MHAAFLKMVDIEKRFGSDYSQAPLLKNITYTFKHPESYAITGVSGTGKSTFMQLLAGLERPTKGTIYFNNKDVSQMNEHEQQHYRTASIGLLFQQPHLMKELSVLENVALAAQLAGMQLDNHCSGIFGGAGKIFSGKPAFTKSRREQFTGDEDGKK